MAKKQLPITDLYNPFFLLCWIEGSDACQKGHSLADLLENEDQTWEYIYAIQEEMSKVMNLAIGERLNMSFNRDNRSDSQGYIKRIK